MGHSPVPPRLIVRFSSGFAEASGDDRGAQLSRAWLFAWLFLLLALNSIAGQIGRTIAVQGFADGLIGLYGVSAIVWAAIGAGIAILRRDQGELAPRRPDLIALAAGCAAALVPFATASMVALSLVSLYAIVTSEPGSPLRRSALVFLAVTAALLWGRVVLATFSRPLLDIDASFVALLLGADRRGNMIWFAGEPLRLIIAPGCSSLQGISLALLLWVVINQLFAVPFNWKASAWCAVALATTFAINVLRIGAMLIFPDRFDAIHSGWGYHLSMWLTLIVVSLLCLYGARREIFARR